MRELSGCRDLTISGRLAALAYVTAPALLILIWDAYLAAVVVALPLSLAANIAAYVVAALMLPSIDSNGAPVAAVMMSGAALLQLLAVRSLLRHRRRR